MLRVGRPPTCECGECERCRKRVSWRRWYRSLSPERKRALIARRDPERVRENDRRKQARRRREGTPEQRQRIAARDAVKKARLRGELVLGPCEQASGDCSGPINAHHDDHARPLDVRWLCRHHHEALHAYKLEAA